MASQSLSLLTTTTTSASKSSFLLTCNSKASSSSSSNATNQPTGTTARTPSSRRDFTLSMAGLLASSSSSLLLLPVSPALAENDEEYVKDTKEVIEKLRSTISLDKKDLNVASAVAELREASNTWVAKFRREKALLGRASFRDVYSALNAVSGHYISFGPTAPIPAKRKARILEEVDTAEKSLLRGR